jgi:phage terminase Nu1 subunit (DNA packaging protein)
MPIVATRPEAAAILEVTVKTIGDWKKEPGFPHRDDGQYDTDAIAAWRATAKATSERAGTQATELRLHLAAEKLRIARVDRESKELDLQLKKKMLMPRETVLKCLSAWATGMRELAGNLQRAGDQAAARQVADKVELIKKQVHGYFEDAIRDAT